MSQNNVEIVREAMDAYNLGDKDGWARFMDPGLETFPVPEFPEPGSLIGPDAAWDFYQRFGETMAASKLYETSDFETAELIDAGDRVVACQRTPLHGRGGEVVVELWGFTRSIRGDGSELSGSGAGTKPSKPPGCRSSALDETRLPAAAGVVYSVEGAVQPPRQRPADVRAVLQRPKSGFSAMSEFSPGDVLAPVRGGYRFVVGPSRSGRDTGRAMSQENVGLWLRERDDLEAAVG
jgi:ketosteroid isomerase-like protein